MKFSLSVLFFFTLLLSANAQVAEINWMTVEEAIEAQKKEPRKILIDVYTQWCGPCKMMDRTTFHDPEVVSYINANYYAVKFDAESPEDLVFKGQTFSNPDYVPNKAGRNGVHQFSRALRVSAYPTVVFLDESLNILTGVRGVQQPAQIELYLKFFALDMHLSENPQATWENYRDNFKPSF